MGETSSLHARGSVRPVPGGQSHPANPNARILADELQADAIGVLAGTLRPFIGRRDPLFDPYLRAPIGRVSHFLVPDVRTVSNYLTGNYRELYARGAPFLELEHEVSRPGGLSWRLYRIWIR